MLWELDEDQRDRLGRLRETACWGWALDHVGRDSEEADLLRQVRGNIERAHRLFSRVPEKARELLDEITRDFAELLILRPDVLLALGVRLEDV